MGLVQFIVDRLHPLPNKPLPLEILRDPKKLGEEGERLAAHFLARKRCNLLYRHFKPKMGGEVDLVVRDQETLVFVEIKTRQSESHGRPFEQIQDSQKERITRSAMAWMQMLDSPPKFWRFDVIEILVSPDEAPKIEWIQNAFQMHDDIYFGI